MFRHPSYFSPSRPPFCLSFFPLPLYPSSPPLSFSLPPLQVFNLSRGLEAQLLVRLIQTVVSLAFVLAIILLVLLTPLTVADLFSCLLAFIATGWGILQVRSRSLIRSCVRLFFRWFSR